MRYFKHCHLLGIGQDVIQGFLLIKIHIPEPVNPKREYFQQEFWKDVEKNDRTYII